MEKMLPAIPSERIVERFTADALVFTVDAVVPSSPFRAACVRELYHTQRNTSLDLKRLFGLPT